MNRPFLFANFDLPFTNRHFRGVKMFSRRIFKLLLLAGTLPYAEVVYSAEPQTGDATREVDRATTASDSVCHGSLCDSGECVPHASMCGVIEELEGAESQAQDTEGTPDRGNSDRIRSRMQSDEKRNGYLCGDGDCVASAKECLEDSSAPAQDYNSSRSNKPGS